MLVVAEATVQHHQYLQVEVVVVVLVEFALVLQGQQEL
jgi:hypothetical protein